MVDKPNQTVAGIPVGADAEQILDSVRWQTNALRHIGREASVVIFGKAERAYLDDYLKVSRKTDDGVTRLFGLEVKVDGDVGVRVG